MKIPININLEQLRKGFREVGKLQEKNQRVRMRQLRTEDKASKGEMKNLKKEHSSKYQLMKKETDHQKRLSRDRNSFIKKEQNFTKTQGREADKGFRQVQRQMKGIGKEAKKQGFGRRTAGRVGKAAMFGAGGIMGMLMGYTLRAYQNYMGAQQAMQPVVGTGMTYPGLMGQRSRGGGGNLGFDIRQRAGMAPAMARSTGATSVVPMMEAMRATGMGAQEVGGAFGAMRAGGTRFEGKDSKGKREFSKMIAAGTASGLEQGRLPEFFQGITQLMQTQQSTSAGDVGAGGFSRLAAILGGTELSGFQGKRGTQLMGKLQQGILKPGGGESGMSFMRQAFGFGRPGGGSSFYSAEKQREKGLGENAEGFGTVMQELSRQYGTGEDAVLKLREVFGTSIEQGEELVNLFKSGDLSKENMGKVKDILEKAEPLEVQAAKQMKNAATALTEIAGRFDTTVGDGAKAREAIVEIEKVQQKLFELARDNIPILIKAIQSLAETAAELFLWLKEKFGDLPTTPEGIVNLAADTVKNAAGKAVVDLLPGGDKRLDGVPAGLKGQMKKSEQEALTFMTAGAGASFRDLSDLDKEAFLAASKKIVKDIVKDTPLNSIEGARELRERATQAGKALGVDSTVSRTIQSSAMESRQLTARDREIGRTAGASEQELSQAKGVVGKLGEAGDRLFVGAKKLGDVLENIPTNPQTGSAMNPTGKPKRNEP